MAEARAVAFLDLNLTGFERAVDSAKRTLGNLAAAFVGFKTGQYFTKGIKDAIDFGNAMHNASREAGNFDPGKLLLVQKALEQAGRSTEEAHAEINSFLDTGRRLEDIFRGSEGYSQALAQVTSQYGKQAEILSTNAKRFSQVFDTLRVVGDKMREFFLGMTAQFLVPLQRLLETLQKINLAKVAEDFGTAIGNGINALVGAFQNPELIVSVLEQAFNTAAKSLGNLLAAVFTTTVKVFRDAFIETMAGVGQIITGILINAFQEPLVYLQAGLQKIAQEAANIPNKAKVASSKFGEMLAEDRFERDPSQANLEELRRRQAITKEFETGAGPSLEELAQSIRESGGFKFGIGEGQTGQELVDSGAKTAADGLAKAAEALKKFEVLDIFGSEEEKATLKGLVENLKKLGEKVTPTGTKPDDVRNTTTEPYKVIGDSLAKIGGGGGFIRASQTMLEKEAVKTNRSLAEQLDVQRKILSATQAKNINYMAGG